MEQVDSCSMLLLHKWLRNLGQNSHKRVSNCARFASVRHYVCSHRVGIRWCLSTSSYILGGTELNAITMQRGLPKRYQNGVPSEKSAKSNNLKKKVLERVENVEWTSSGYQESKQSQRCT